MHICPLVAMWLCLGIFVFHSQKLGQFQWQLDNLTICQVFGVSWYFQACLTAGKRKKAYKILYHFMIARIILFVNFDDYNSGHTWVRGILMTLFETAFTVGLSSIMNHEAQTVSDKLWHELLLSIGLAVFTDCFLWSCQVVFVVSCHLPTSCCTGNNAWCHWWLYILNLLHIHLSAPHAWMHLYVSTLLVLQGITS